MASIFRKLTGRRKKNKASGSNTRNVNTEALSIETTHTSELDADSPSRPLHLTGLRGKDSNSHRRARSRSSDRSKGAKPGGNKTEPQDGAKLSVRRNSRSGGTSNNKEPTVVPKRNTRVGSQNNLNHHGGSDHGGEPSQRSFRFGFRSNSQHIVGSASYDSEDETAATSTSTTPLKRGKKNERQLAAQAATVLVPSSNRRPESAPSDEVVRLTAEEIAKQNAANKETERIARAAAALDNRGNEYFERGYYDKAMDAYSRALKLKRRTFHSMLEEADDLFDETEENKKIDSDDKEMDPKLLVSMATSINNIGYLRQRAGEATPDETMSAYKKSLRIKRKILGNDSLSVGKTLNNIGSVYYLKKDFTDALPAYEEALAIMQANLGIDHPDVATVISNMGDVNLALKRRGEALDRYRVALDIRWNAFGEKDPRTMRLLEKIARIEVGDKMPTPRGTKVQRQFYDWDESELYDLDLRPISYELRLLKDQVKEDIEAVDILEKKIATGMVRDKVKIVRGMRELIEAQEKNHGSFRGLEGSFSYDSFRRGDESNHDYDDLLNSPGMLPAMTESKDDDHTNVSPKTRTDAQSRVQQRLAKLRTEKGMDPTGPLALPLMEDAPAKSNRDEIKSDAVGPSSFLRTALISTGQRPNRAALSSMKPEEIKEQVQDVESALKLKKGIDNLRSLSRPNTAKAEDTMTTMKTDESSDVTTENTDVSTAVENENVEDTKSCSSESKASTSSQRDVKGEEVTSFFKNLIEKPAVKVHGRRGSKLVHATWLGAAPVAVTPTAEAETSFDSVEKMIDKPYSKAVEAPKLMHTTWLGEIDG